MVLCHVSKWDNMLNCMGLCTSLLVEAVGMESVLFNLPQSSELTCCDTGTPPLEQQQECMLCSGLQCLSLPNPPLLLGHGR
jgi:hypothetical protein